MAANYRGLDRRLFMASLAASPAVPALLETVSEASAEGVADLATFMAVSKALTKRDGLDETLGQRYFDALKMVAGNFDAVLPGLASALQAGPLNDDQKKLALAIQRAWYIGQVETIVIAYEEALMFQAVSDVIYLRAYCPDKPGYWAAKPAAA